jgi:autoinducer 2-degrading protein
MSENKVFFMVKWQIQPGQEAVVTQALAQLVVHSRTEPGCLYYQPHVSSSQPDVIYLYEVYANQAAATAHRATDYFQQLVLKTIVPLLSAREVVDVTPISDVVNTRF